MRKLFIIGAIVLSNTVNGQDTIQTISVKEVSVYATRADKNTPMTYSLISKEEIGKRNLGQDLPSLIRFTPSIVTSSDAGAGIGYTQMRIRGSDASRINVTINGIPLNDPESHGVFWVNVPDLSSSLNSIQIQRGVGTSSNGAGAFGATVNLKTNNFSNNSFFKTDNSVGSFNTIKNTINYNSGILNQRYNFELRLSRISSDGYIDRSSAKLKSYFFSGGYLGDNTIIKAIAFGGEELTQQAWFGTPEAKLNGTPESLQKVINMSGGYTTAQQITNLKNSDRRFNYYLYDNEIDNYRQDHYQLHLKHNFKSGLLFSTAIHYTRGRGFFEQFKNNAKLNKFGMSNTIAGSDTIERSDVIVRRWLDNHFIGTVYSLDYSKKKLNATLGGSINRYFGMHFGEIIWSQFASNSEIRDKYYTGNSKKDDFNTFLKGNYKLYNNLILFADMQVRAINYTTKGTDNDLSSYSVDEKYTFLNPKFGLTYKINDSLLVYASYAVANREPIRSDFIDADEGETPLHETLNNLEVGMKLSRKALSFEVNYYLMNYKNQLVQTGAVNDVGGSIRTNVKDSYRFGIELSSSYQFSKSITWSINTSLSKNKIEKFDELVTTSSKIIKHRNTDISFSPTIIAGSIVSYSPTKKFLISFQTKYVGEQFLDNTSNQDRIITAYVVSDVLFEYNFSFAKVNSAKISLLVNNVFDHEYSSNGNTWGFYHGNDERYQQNNYYPQAGINFIIGTSLTF